MKGELNKSLIEGIIRNFNSDYVESTDDKIRTLVSYAVESLSSHIPYVNFDNTVLQPMNELMTNGFTDNSSFIYFLGVDNSQIEINSLRSDLWKRVKKRIIFAWKNRNANRKRRRKKQQPQPEVHITEQFDPGTYNLASLTQDFMYAVAENLSETSIVYNEENRIRIVGKDDFGSNTQILIYVTLYDGEYFKYFLNRKKGFLKIDNGMRMAAINNKISHVGNLYCQMIKILNSLYFNVNHNIPNQIFIESVLFNCPNELYTKDLYNSLLKILNYISMTDTKEFKSIINPDKDIYTDPMCGSTGIGFKRLITKLNDLKG